ncbi:hypothetical protein LINPERPRIM_LOCUS13241 [Linum perenne]
MQRRVSRMPFKYHENGQVDHTGAEVSIIVLIQVLNGQVRSFLTCPSLDLTWAFTNAINGATTSNSKRSSSSISPSSSSVSSFFFTNSCSSDNLIHPQPSYHCRGHFRGREAIGFRCYFHLSINRLKLEQLLSLIGTLRHANLVQLIGASVS